MVDKWDVIEVLYRSAILIFLVGGVGYFAWKLLDILRYNTHWIAYPIAVVITLAWLLFSISVFAWLTLVAKGTFRPNPELEDELTVVELEGDVPDDFTIEPEEYGKENNK